MPRIYKRHASLVYSWCRACYQQFGAYRSDARYCSAKCRQAVSRALKKYRAQFKQTAKKSTSPDRV